MESGVFSGSSCNSETYYCKISNKVSVLYTATVPANSPRAPGYVKQYKTLQQRKNLYVSPKIGTYYYLRALISLREWRLYTQQHPPRIQNSHEFASSCGTSAVDEGTCTHPANAAHTYPKAAQQLPAKPYSTSHSQPYTSTTCPKQLCSPLHNTPCPCSCTSNSRNA